ncbi:MAG: DinB family protein, partial [Balneolaceae bacterium]|nr:DinB family protein [Balneolaceae bacterium]
EEDSFKEKQHCISLLSHIINAQKIWYSRVVEHSKEDNTEFWTEYELDMLKPKARKASQKWIDFVADNDVNLDLSIEYQNSKGKNFKNTIWEICTHMVIHGQHHRAQISLLLRNCDINPPEIDYIHYARSGS